MWLKLRWARFFTLAGWKWKLSPRPGFDFQVSLPCNHHQDCNGSHSLLVRTCEKTGKALEQKHCELYDCDFMYSEPHPALFGDGPDNTVWQMVHGDGGGTYSVSSFGNANKLWERAAHE